MASPIMCNGPDGGPAVVMVTMLADGDTVGLCSPCLTDWCHALIKATSPELLADQPPPAARRPRAKRVTPPIGGTPAKDIPAAGVTLVPGGQADGV